MNKEFIRKNNSAVALTLLLADILEEKWVEVSAWFRPDFISKTLKFRGMLRLKIVNLMQKNSDKYNDDMLYLSALIESFINVSFDAAFEGKQEDILQDINKILDKHGIDRKLFTMTDFVNRNL